MKEPLMSRIRNILRRVFGTKDRDDIADSKERIARAEDAVRSAPPERARRALTSVSVALFGLVALGGCASFPRLRLELGAFGVTAALDTREMTSEIGDVAVALKDFVLPRPPETAAAGPVVETPTVPAPEPVK